MNVKYFINITYVIGNFDVIHGATLHECVVAAEALSLLPRVERVEIFEHATCKMRFAYAYGQRVKGIPATAQDHRFTTLAAEAVRMEAK